MAISSWVFPELASFFRITDLKYYRIGRESMPLILRTQR